MFLEKIIKLYHRKRAVSPIIAAILLIGLTVIAAIAVFVLINSFTGGSGASLSSMTVNGTTGTVSTVNATSMQFGITITNSGTADTSAKILNVTLVGNQNIVFSLNAKNMTYTSNNVDQTGNFVTIPKSLGANFLVTVNAPSSLPSGTYTFKVAVTYNAPVSASQTYTITNIQFTK